MTNEEKYDLLADGETGLPSTMGVLPSSKGFVFSDDAIETSLKQAKDFRVRSISRKEDTETYSEQAYVADIEFNKESYEVELLVVKTELDLRDFGFANQIEDADLEKATQCPFYLETTMFFTENVLASFHLQIKIMMAIVPDAALLIDFMSYRLLSAKWGRMAAKSQIPPSPDYLYTLHGVYEGEEDDRRYWFHTHGLLRCGSVELEIVNVSQGPQQMNDLVNMVVKKFIESPTKENERFTIGYDGLGINLAWLRWEEALKDFPEKILGGKEDRTGDGNVHAEPSGVLFAVEDNNLVSPEIYAHTLADNPIYYISTEETNRMSALAKERFPFFKAVFEREAKPQNEKTGLFHKIFGKKKQEEAPAWSFLVKLGLSVDDENAGSEKEHLWFEVVSLDNDAIEGKLLNQPYWISDLNEGDVNKYPVDLLTDWLIYSPDSTYTTDSIYQLGFQ